MRRYLIVGSGVAGISAARAIRSIDAQGEIVLISDDPFGYYSRPGLAYYLSGEMDESLLFPFKREDYRELQLQWCKDTVLQIDVEKHLVQLVEGGVVSYDQLLLATGSEAVPLNVPGAHLSGVTKLDNMQDARDILKRCRHTRTAVVVGGGITALELAEGLRARGVHVNYFLRGDRYWSSVLDETESQIVENRLQHEGVKIHYRTELAEIKGKKESASHVVTKDGRTLRCELVAAAIGVQPRIELARAAGLKIDRGIEVNQMLQSSAADVYAAGDAAQVYDPYSQRSVLDTLWNAARQQGHVAGLNMAGCSSQYIKSVPYNVTRLAGVTTTIIGTVGQGKGHNPVGIVRGDSETWQYRPEALTAASSYEVNRLRVLVGEKTIVGAIVMGDQTLSQPLQELISEKVDIRSIRENLLTTSQPGETIARFWAERRDNFAEPEP